MARGSYRFMPCLTVFPLPCPLSPERNGALLSKPIHDMQIFGGRLLLFESKAQVHRTLSTYLLLSLGFIRL